MTQTTIEEIFLQHPLWLEVLTGWLRLLVMSITLPLMLMIASLKSIFDLLLLLGRRTTKSAIQQQPLKHIVITGASAGIGRELALLYAESIPTIRLCLTGRNRQRLLEVAERCESLGAQVDACLVDVGDIEAMERKLLEIDDRLPVDLIIANAGVNSNTLRQSASADYGAFGVNGDRLDFVDMIRPIVQTDFVGTIGSFEPLLRRFMQRRRGQIALVSSMAGLMPVLSTPTYSSVKSALVRLTEGLRPVLGRYNVRLNVVCPGYVRTNMNASFKQTPLFRSLVDCRQAAQWIQQGLERDCGLIVFPITQYLLVTAVYAVPQPIREWLFLNLWRRGWLPKEGEVVTCPL